MEWEEVRRVLERHRTRLLTQYDTLGEDLEDELERVQSVHERLERLNKQRRPLMSLWGDPG